IRPPPTPTLFPYTTLFRSIIGGRSADARGGMLVHLHFPDRRSGLGVDSVSVAAGIAEVGHPLVRVRAHDAHGILDPAPGGVGPRSEEHTSELQSPCNLVCR